MRLLKLYLFFVSNLQTIRIEVVIFKQDQHGNHFGCVFILNCATRVDAGLSEWYHVMNNLVENWAERLWNLLSSPSVVDIETNEVENGSQNTNQ